MAKRRKRPDAAYRNAVKEMGGLCWRCGRNENTKPYWWNAEWMIERSHIVNKPRREDRRAVIPLCSLCHRIEHGDRFQQFPNMKPIPLDVLLGMKRDRDPEYFDMEWLQRHSVSILPEPAIVY